MLITASWALAPCLFLAAAAGSVPPDLQQAVRERHKALEAADAETWDRQTSPDFTLVTPDGQVHTKAERLATLRTQKPRPFAREQEHIRVYGDTAVERILTSNSWITTVWVKQPQGWQVVFTQMTRVAK